MTFCPHEAFTSTRKATFLLGSENYKCPCLKLKQTIALVWSLFLLLFVFLFYIVLSPGFVAQGGLKLAILLPPAYATALGKTGIGEGRQRESMIPGLKMSRESPQC
jgi:hypothetical protein